MENINRNILRVLRKSTAISHGELKKGMLDGSKIRLCWRAKIVRYLLLTSCWANIFWCQEGLEVDQDHQSFSLCYFCETKSRVFFNNTLATWRTTNVKWKSFAMVSVSWKNQKLWKTFKLFKASHNIRIFTHFYSEKFNHPKGGKQF